MYSAKTVAFAILFGNCIGFFLWAGVMALGTSSENPSVETQESNSIFGVKSVVKVPYKGQENQIKTGSLAIIDYILGLWFIFSTGWALWVILNPIPS
jgi:hypothetical protein